MSFDSFRKNIQVLANDENKLVVQHKDLNTILEWKKIPGEKVKPYPLHFLYHIPKREAKSVSYIYCYQDRITIKTNNHLYFENIMMNNGEDNPYAAMLDDIIPEYVDPAAYNWTSMPFGKHKGKSLWDIFQEDPSYIWWLETQDIIQKKSPKLRQDFRLLISMERVQKHVKKIDRKKKKGYVSTEDPFADLAPIIDIA